MSSCSSDTDPDTDPHVVMRERNYYNGVYDTPIATFLANASTCLDCNLVLQVIEAVKPGWVKENAHLGLVDYHREKSEDDKSTIVPQFTLHLQQSVGMAGVDLHQPTSFHFFKRAATARYEPHHVDSHAGKSPEFTGNFLARSLEVTHDSGSQQPLNELINGYHTVTSMTEPVSLQILDTSRGALSMSARRMGPAIHSSSNLPSLPATQVSATAGEMILTKS
ncbi:hypothetical protein AAWM_03698 [Aspergillus awamori]|uniref:Uncharacterized protein n=1 Tax=Aspergillus awamori TaxID=105351 RepID=A0A401KNF0_ASPAW|nr:hypothetical protein AAWM_03698 [Aspergillus awamori]